MKVLHQTWNCSKCEKKENQRNFCPECGAKAPNPMIKFCKECKKKAKPDDKFCQDCGQKLDEIQIIENDDYIEFIPPLCNIHMIEPRNNQYFSWIEVEKHLKNLNNGKINDWRLPTKEELEMIYKIEKDLCDNIDDYIFWNSSICNDSSNGTLEIDPYDENPEILSKDGRYKLRCVR